jgi:hypothetical protein
MSEKKRAKKDGHDTSKDRAAMRESVKQRHELAATSRAGETPDDHDKPDFIPYKSGSAEDRSVNRGNLST